jgi:predicted ATPase
MYQSQLEDHYSGLAYHYGHSANTQKAVEYLRLAGQQALQRSANAAAIDHLTNGLELVRALPDTLERSQQELALQITLGSVLVATQGYTTPAVKNVYTRAQELCRQVGDTPQLFSVINGLRRFYYLRAEFTKARELTEQLLRLAQSGNDPALFVLVHQALGVVSYSVAELAAARKHLERAPALYDARQHRFHTLFYGEDPSVIAMSFDAGALWLLGYPDKALEKSHQALSLARELSHPLSLALALNFAAWLHQLRGERQAVQDRIEAAITLGGEQGLPNWLAQATILAGWTMSEEAHGEGGIAQMREGLAAYHSTGALLITTYFLALLAEAYGKIEQPEQGLGVLDEALALAGENGERFYEPELYRLKGELTLQQSRVQASNIEGSDTKSVIRNPQAELEAEKFFRKAIDIASRRQAKSLELRAVTSLCRLRQQQGKDAEARQMLENIYGWFTEGFDTADLKQARSLLDELPK